jgi:glycosyltransferase involved in cell wall biosynthesis
MKISVIVPSYKPADYLWKCLDSLAAQSLDKTHFEIVLVLNGCNEPYCSEISQYMLAYQKNGLDFRLIQTNIVGVCHARNVGIEAAKGDYLAFVDDDDWVSFNYLENLLAVADKDCVVEANVLRIDEVSGHSLNYFLTEAFAKNQSVSKLTFFGCRSFLSNVCCKLIPRKIIGDDRFNRDYKLGEDSLFMFHISRRIHQIRMTSGDTIYYVRERSNSASRKTYSCVYRARLALSLMGSYLGAYLKDFRHYKFLFFISRIIATARKPFLKHYE